MDYWNTSPNNLPSQDSSSWDSERIENGNIDELSQYEVHSESCGVSNLFEDEAEGVYSEAFPRNGFHDNWISGAPGSPEWLHNVNSLIESSTAEKSITAECIHSLLSPSEMYGLNRFTEHVRNPIDLLYSDSLQKVLHEKGLRLEQIGTPNTLLSKELKSGDILIKSIPGYGRSYEGILVDGTLQHTSELNGESAYVHPEEKGYYGRMIENFPVARVLADPGLRRITDSDNMIPGDTHIFRLERETVSPMSIIETGGTFRKIRPNEVQYLALEGGGGKGFAFIGAIQRLEQMGIVRFRNGRLDNSRLKGISGASAGAISAVFLALGHNSTSITSIMNSVNFNSFFDVPTYRRKVPVIGGCRTRSEGAFLQTILRTLTSIVRRIPILGNRASNYVAEKFREYLSSPRRSVNINSGPLQKLLAYWPLYLRNLFEDFGVFSGCAAREFFDQKIAEKFNNRRGITFSQMFDKTGIHLVLTTVNVETGNSEYLSHETTPSLPVADGIRMSMSLPYVYKPYRVTATDASRMGNRRLAGLYVDGGTRNNIPIRAFQRFVRSGVPNTLGLRLELDKQGRIDNILKFFLHYSLMPGLLGTGESNVSVTSGYSEQIISLDTTGLSTLNFNPQSSIRNTVITRSNRAVTRYFQ